MKRKDKHGMERKKGRSGSNRTILIHSNEERGGGRGGSNKMHQEGNYQDLLKWEEGYF